MNNDSKQRSVFCEFPIPEDMRGNDPESICVWFNEMWVQEKPTRQALTAYCISENGFHHVHTVFSQDTQFRWSAVRKIFDGIGGDIQATRGTKEQALAYIRKEGKHAEKGEQVICEKSLGGEIQSNQGHRTDLDEIDDFIKMGYTPSQIFDIDIKYRRREKIVKDAFFAHRKKTVPPKRDVDVIWHCGEARSGKTYGYVKDCEEYGEDEVYLLTDYESGGFDWYNGQRILYMDEFRGQIKWSTLLTYLEGYKVQVHCRYGNACALWDTIHITTVMPPEMVYRGMVEANSQIDTFKQLRDRIKTIVYHWKTENGEYKQFALPMSEYVDYETLKATALSGGFVPLAEDIETPFTEQLSIYNYNSDNVISQ